MQINSPRDLFLHELHLIYDVEHKVRDLLREVSGKITDKDLSQMMRAHVQEMGEEISRLDQVFHELGEKPQRMPCAGIDGIRQDYETIAAQNPSPHVLDMAVLSTGMKIEHYETGAYRALVDRALLMNETVAAQILQAILYEEEETAAKLERMSHDMGQRVLAAA
ncbi:MAG TPA: DUF892 family protein [Micromonosporaceae bacterium]